MSEEQVVDQAQDQAQEQEVNNIFNNVGNGEQQQDQQGEQQTQEVTYDFSDTLKSMNLELDEATTAEFTTLLKECGVNNEHANKLAKYGLELQQKAVDSVVGELEARELAWQEQFKTEMGNNFDASLQKIGIAKEWAERNFQGFTQMAIETGAGNHPVFLKMMSKLADLVGEENGNKLNGVATGGNSIYGNTDWEKYK